MGNSSMAWSFDSTRDCCSSILSSSFDHWTMSCISLPLTYARRNTISALSCSDVRVAVDLRLAIIIWCLVLPRRVRLNYATASGSTAEEKWTRWNNECHYMYQLPTHAQEAACRGWDVLCISGKLDPPYWHSEIYTEQCASYLCLLWFRRHFKPHSTDSIAGMADGVSGK